MKRIAVVGHADADGHLIAEQVRRNLAKVPTFDVSLVVDPVRTRDHTAWKNLSSLTPHLDNCDYVFFVDMMFAPASFADEADALVQFARERPATRFFLIDHHPLPLRRLRQAANLHATYREDVFDCTFGTSSFLMLVAALLESQPTRAHKLRRPIHLELARGVHRAAAIGGSLPGEKLLALLQHDCWEDLRDLGNDKAEFHRLPRGRRPRDSPVSETFKRLEMLATSLLSERQPEPDNARKNLVAYDFDTSMEVPFTLHLPDQAATEDPKDLEAIVMLLELAALQLTDRPEATFSTSELLATANELAGSMLIEESDIKIVLGKAGFLKKLSGGKLRMK